MLETWILWEEMTRIQWVLHPLPPNILVYGLVNANFGILLVLSPLMVYSVENMIRLAEHDLDHNIFFYRNELVCSRKGYED